MIKENADKILKKAPTEPGVYFFWDKNTIIYAGKATNLKSRLRSYFNAGNSDSRKVTMVERATRLTWQTAISPIEALIIEAKLIKQHKPYYNVSLRDDKQYFYVGFTEETCPRIFLIHQPAKTNNKIEMEYIGPFTDGAALKRTLKLLRKIFPYRTHKNMPKNCLWYTLGLCPISEKPTSEEIKNCQNNIEAIKRILQGEIKRLVKNLKKEMLGYAKLENFEKAVKLRDQINGLENIYAHKKIIGDQTHEHKNSPLNGLPESLLEYLPKKDVSEWLIEGYDISNIQGGSATGSLISFMGKKPIKALYKKFRIKTVEGANDVAMHKEVMGRRLTHYKEWPLPDIFLIDGGRPQVNAVNNTLLEWQKLYDIPFKKMPIIIGLAKRQEELYITTEKKPYALSHNNPILLMFMHARDESHRFAKSYHHKLRSKTESA